jgi:hypothetical protein
MADISAGDSAGNRRMSTLAPIEIRSPQCPHVPSRSHEIRSEGADGRENSGNGGAQHGVRAATNNIPEHPGPFVPPPFDLEHAYHQAIAEIHLARGTTPPRGSYARKVRDQAFWAFYWALSDSCCTIIMEHHPDGAWAKQDRPRLDMHVVASAPGSGKSTLAKAFAVALARITRGGEHPFGCVFVVQHIATAHAVFVELSKLLPPGSVAVFTTKHDAGQPLAEYSQTFWVSELARHPITVVTHEFYMGIRGEQARRYTQDGVTFPRVVTFIDERANEIAVYDADPMALEGVLKFVQRDRQAPRELLDGLLELVQFTNSKRGRREQGIETPADDTAAWQAAIEATSYVRSDEAAKYARSATARRPALDFDAVFGFANAMPEDRAFIARGNNGVINFVGYEQALPRLPGMVLLDATADIDGITEVCRFRKHAKLPPERYDRLEIIHVPSIAKGNLRRWLSEPGNMYAYAGHIQGLIRCHVRPGHRALVVCPKAAAVAEDVFGWSEHVQRFLKRSSPEDNHETISDTEFTYERAWSFEGRLIAVTWFGGYGIGANLWRDADVVIVCDDFYLPQRVVRATLQGLRGHKATEGLLANHETTWSDELAYLQDGHILRWMKQMALRGKGRDMDEHGVCGQQKLVITGDLLRLLRHRPKVFPGAKITPEQSGGTKLMDRLVSLLLSLELPKEVSTKVIGKKLGVEWGNSNLPRRRHFKEIVESTGWSYHGGKGRTPGCFRRLKPVELHREEVSGVDL